MIFRVAIGLAILLGLIWASPLGLLAEEVVFPEIPLIELEAVPEVLEAVVEPVVTGFESLTEDIGELLEVAETTLLAEPNAEQEVEEEPELIWGCEMQLDAEGNESERCGLGYYRTLCMDVAEEDCITFFEFYEEEEDPLIQSIVDFEAREFLTLSLTWNGTPLVEDEDSFPLGTTGTLGWSYVSSEPVDVDLPHTYTGSYQEMFDASTLVLQIYKGEIGSAILVHSEEISHDSTSGELPFTFTEDDTYHVILAATFPLELAVPGYECGGELCPLFLARVESLEWFMENARTYFDSDVENIDQSIYFDEHDVTYNRMATYLPLSFGMTSMDTGEAPTGISNVLFLPGIKGSRLYDGSGNKLWEPFGNQDLGQLFLDADGRSARNDIHTKEGDILSRVFGNNFYASFVNQMDALKEDGTLGDWKAIAYDWRLSLDDIVSRGVVDDDRIYFQEKSDIPYIEQSLKELAASSPTGKVSIIAHSNGGLVTKKLMQRLEANGEADLVDQIILVGVPQSGAPQAIAGLLYGYGEALPADRCADSLIGWLCSFLSSRDVARELAENSPMAYHLLPSQAYFDLVRGAYHPVAKFTALTAYEEERNRYGVSVDSSEELYAFLSAQDGGRTKPAVDDTASANVLDASFLNYARIAHDSIDSWIPPPGITVHQIAGWGMNTVAGVEFYEQKKLFGGYKEMYRPIFVEDGDKVVPVPSALLMSSGDVENYWINLRESNLVGVTERNHSDLLELDSVRILVRDILLRSIENLPDFIYRNQPDSADGKKLMFFLHSPLTLEIFDEKGNHVGENGQGGFDEEIPNVEYGEFGDVKYIIAPAGKYNVVMHGKKSGFFSLDVQTVSNNMVTGSFTLADIPTTEKTVATISVSGDLAQAGTLRVDTNGDGSVDAELTPAENSTIIYEPAPAAPTVEVSRGSNQSSRINNIGIASTVQKTTVDTMSEVPKKGSSLISYTTEVDQNQVDATPELSSSESIVKNPPRTQTASAYDAVGANLVNWLGVILYNFWTNLMEILSGFLPTK